MFQMKDKKCGSDWVSLDDFGLLQIFRALSIKVERAEMPDFGRSDVRVLTELLIRIGLRTGKSRRC